MADYNYAVLIQTDTLITDDAMGLYSGCFCWVTGRPNYDGAWPLANPPINPNTGLAQTIWKRNMITKDGLGSPSYSVDLVDLGSYGTQSDLDLEVKNTTGLEPYLRANEIYLGRRKIWFYPIVDDTFYRWWSGIVGPVSHSENTVKIKGIDFHRDLHKDFPPDVVDRVRFPDAKDEVIGKPIPVCIGKVTRAKLLNVKKRSDGIPVYNDGTNDIYETPAASWSITNPGLVTLKTGSLVVLADQWKGKYLSCIRGGPKTAIRIAWNSASSSGETVVSLEEFFKVGSKIATIAAWSLPTTALFTWYFSVADLEQARIISGRPIASIESSQDGTGSVLDIYEDGEYLSVAALKYTSSLSNIAQTGYAGFLVSVGGIKDGSSAQSAVGFITPTAAVRRSPMVGATASGVGVTLDAASTWPTVNGTTLPLLLDGSRSTGYSIIANRSGGSSGFMTFLVAFDLAVPPQAYKNWEDGIYLMLDLVTEYAPDSFNSIIVDAIVAVRGKDIFGSITGTQANSAGDILSPPNNAYSVAGTKNHFFINPKYYDLTEAWNEALAKPQLDISKLFQDWKSIKAYPTINVELQVRVTSAAVNHSFTLHVREAVIQTGKRVDFSNEDLYSRVIGTTYENTWFGRRTPPDPVAGVLDAAELFFQRLDPDASGYVDLASWNSAAAQRPPEIWQVGRQVTDRKNSIDYLMELCKHGHFCITPLPDGKRQVVCWAENSGGPTLDESSWVNKDQSPTHITETSTDRCFTEFELNYDFDVGLGKCKRTFFLKNTDQAAFPAEATLRTGTNTPEWKFWVGGVKEYALAGTLWTVAKIGHNITKTNNTLRMDLPWFSSNEDWGGDSDDDAVIALVIRLLAWVIAPKKVFTKNLPINATTLTYTLAQVFTLSDALIANPSWKCWFTGLRLNTQEDLIEASILSFPWDLT